ncbi:hypothetical protein HPB50_006215 [Hyalomma asiaticum]|uniref:Uncharacterized protein n=1 Tax=Hyalomma asiaticum TaxID=266040 RepID=A0ACB7RII6_HYAAI|nr:hypothetical protein HPB50_006215 [Hyalomma asiaticum]
MSISPLLFPCLHDLRQQHLPHADFYPNGTVRTYLFATSLIQLLWDTADKFTVSYRTRINPVNVWGNRLPNGTWTGFLGEIQRNETDVAFTLFTPTVDRNQLAEASDPVWHEDAVILGGFSAAAAHQISLTGSFTVFGMEVPSPRTPRQVSARIVIAFWWLAMLVLTNFFTGEMKAALTVRQPVGHRVDSAAELAARDDMKAYTMAGTVYHLLLAHSPKDHDRQVAGKLTANFRLRYHQLYSPAVLDEVANGRAVIIADRTSAVYQIARACHSYPGHEFYFGREPLFSHIMVIYYGRNLERKLDNVMTQWNKRMNWLTEAGVLHKWKEHTQSLAGDFSRCPKIRMGEAEQLDFEHHQPIFVLILVGHAAALIALLAELAVNSIAATSGTFRRPARLPRTFSRRIKVMVISP